MVRRFLVIPLMVVLVSGLIFAGCAKPAPSPAPAPTVEEEVVVVKYGQTSPKFAGMVRLVDEPWIEALEKAAHGRLEIDFYPGAVLAGPLDTFDAVRMGIMDISVGTHQYKPGRFPLSSLSSVAVPHATSSWIISRAMDELTRKTPEIMAEYEPNLYLGYCAFGPSCFQTTKPVRTLEDLKGMKIRSPGGNLSRVIEALGAVPVEMTFSEAYDAVAKGIVEGTIFPLECLLSARMIEVTSYYTVGVSLGTSSDWYAMNLDKYNSLPQDIKKVFDEHTGAYLADLGGKGMDMADQEAIELAMRTEGKEFIQLPPEEVARWDEALKPLADGWAANMEAKGLPGRDILDEYARLVAKYSAEEGAR